jgi:hypothetical protein
MLTGQKGTRIAKQILRSKRGAKKGTDTFSKQTAVISSLHYKWTDLQIGETGHGKPQSSVHDGKCPGSNKLGDFLPCKLQKRPVNCGFYNPKWRKNLQVQQAGGFLHRIVGQCPGPAEFGTVLDRRRDTDMRHKTRTKQGTA